VHDRVAESGERAAESHEHLESMRARTVLAPLHCL
jgi:hypothetical protein